MGFFKKNIPENQFDAFQRRVGKFVALPNAIMSIALFIIIIVIHSLSLSDISLTMFVSFSIYVIIFFILYSREPFMNTSKSSISLFQKMKYEELSMLIIFINKLGKLFIGFIFPIFGFYVFLLTLNLLVDGGHLNGKTDIDALSSLLSAIFYVMLIPIIGALNILFFKLFVSSYLDYHFQFSQGCMRIILKYPEIFDDALSYMIKESIWSYDLYLRRFTLFGFRDKNQICSELILKPRKELFIFLYKYVNTFSDEDFSPARTIARLILKSHIKDILIENNTLHKIKDYSPIFIISIVSVSSIVSFLYYSGIIPPF